MFARFFAAVTAAPVVIAAAAAPAHAAVVRHDHLTIRVPSSATSYNGQPVTVAPMVTATPGSHRTVIYKRISAFRSGHRVQGGHASLRLLPGTYSVATTVKYRTYRYVTRTRTVRSWHGGWTPDGSHCTVTAVTDWDGDGVGDAVKSADCTNAGYPGQVVHAYDPLDNADASRYEVGDTFRSDYVFFKGQYVSKRVKYRAKHWTGYHFFTTARKTLIVVDGGHRRVFSSVESDDTPYFTAPYNWHATYSYDCSNFGYSGNWILTLHHKDGSVFDDKLLNNDIHYRGSGKYSFTGGGQYRFEVITECAWTIVASWR